MANLSVKTKPRILPPAPLTFALEDSHGAGNIVCGVDEVGRGPLAGPVTACCVYVPPSVRGMGFWQIVTDSKKLSAKKRALLAAEIKSHCVYGLAEASPEEIDMLNIHHATLLAMKRAYAGLRDHISTKTGGKPAYAYIDGKFTPQLDCKAEAMIKGDSRSLSIAAASIVAKVTRDEYMTALAAEFPHYSWESNAGYGTAAHLAGIKNFGITPHHRRSFAPVRSVLESA